MMLAKGSLQHAATGAELKRLNIYKTSAHQGSW